MGFYISDVLLYLDVCFIQAVMCIFFLFLLRFCFCRVILKPLMLGQTITSTSCRCESSQTFFKQINSKSNILYKYLSSSSHAC